METIVFLVVIIIMIWLFVKLVKKLLNHQFTITITKKKKKK